MNRLSISLVSTVMVGAAYFAGAAISSMVTNNGASAAEAVPQPCPTMGLCGGTGSAGITGDSITITVPAGGSGGITPPHP